MKFVYQWGGIIGLISLSAVSCTTQISSRKLPSTASTPIIEASATTTPTQNQTEDIWQQMLDRL